MVIGLEVRSERGMSVIPSLALWRIFNLIFALRSLRVGHSSIARFLAVLPCVRSWLPVANRAALFWIFSRSNIWFS